MQAFKALAALLVRRLVEAGAILTFDSSAGQAHPAFQERIGADGSEERGFRLQIHREHPEEPLSPFYFNLRGPDNPGKSGNLTPEIYDLTALLMVEILQGAGITDIRYLVGVPNAGTPIAEHLARLLSPSPMLLRMEKDGDEIQGFVGEVPREGFVIGVDDLITRAGSKMPVIDIVEDAGLVLFDFVVLVDRDQGGRQELGRRGVGLHSVFDVRSLLRIAAELGAISERSYEVSLQYLKREAARVSSTQ